MARGKTFKKTLARNILKNTFNGTTWVFSLLFNMGVATIDIFLSPSLYKDVSFIEFGANFEENLKKKPKFKEMTIRQSLWRLKKMGFVEQKGKEFLLTRAGKKLAQYVLRRKKIAEAKWDKKYRVVVFDIPEKQSESRAWLRSELYLLNYKKLQKSVFIGKHPLPNDLIKDIKRKKIGNFVNYILADKVYKNLF